MLLNCGVGEDSSESLGLQDSTNLKGNQSWIFTGRTDAEAETPILWPPDAKNSLLGKDLDAGKDWRQEEKGTTEDEMVGWHQWLDGHEFEQAPGAGDGQGSLAYSNPWGCADMTEGLNWTEPIQILTFKTKQTLDQKLVFIFYLSSSYHQTSTLWNDKWSKVLYLWEVLGHCQSCGFEGH